jgi:hypothetical protein
MYLRSPDIDRALRIDALCINQEDVIERNQQVYLMGSIYSQGARGIGLARTGEGQQ